MLNCQSQEAGRLGQERTIGNKTRIFFCSDLNKGRNRKTSQGRPLLLVHSKNFSIEGMVNEIVHHRKSCNMW